MGGTAVASGQSSKLAHSASILGVNLLTLDIPAESSRLQSCRTTKVLDMPRTFWLLFLVGCAQVTLLPAGAVAGDLRIATFEVDATPAIGSPLAYDPLREVTEPLSCRGVVLLAGTGAGDVQAAWKPIVLCTVDWLGVANESHDLFRQRLAEAVGTTVDRVAMHALHQHDAPRCDLSAAKILQPYGQAAANFDVPFIHDVIERTAAAAAASLKEIVVVSNIHFAEAEVEQVASNRRMLGPDGKVHTTRYTACKDPSIRALPVGVIDPKLKLLTFEGEAGPIAALTFYATHPQSYYRTGGANPDFPGMARNARQAETGVFHLHFNGAGGNIGAGKYNDGAHENRQVLADRVADAMTQAWQARHRLVESPSEPGWEFDLVSLPLGEHLDASELESVVADEGLPTADRAHAAEKLAYLRRTQAGHQLAIQSLGFGSAQILFLPGELFIEYQLAAQAMRPDREVLMAAYGDYGTEYIGTRKAYSQGGYEVSDRATNVAPSVERVLLGSLRRLLDAEGSRVLASDFTEDMGALPIPLDRENRQTTGARQ